MVVLLFAAAMWLLARYVGIGLFSVSGQGWMAAALLLTGLAVAAFGIYAFRKARTTIDPLHPDKTATLVTGGIYRITRNPMYVRMALLLLAWAAYLGSVLSLLLLPLFVTYMNHFQIGPEERILLKKFGGTYQRYRQHVRRWL